MTKPTLTGDVWSKIEFDLSEFRDLFHLRLETKVEAIGVKISPGNPKTGKKAEWRDTAPRWEDIEHGKLVRPELLIPYVDAIDQAELLVRLESGRQLLASIELRVASREMTPELLYEWGVLNRWAGAIQLVYHARPDVGRLREGSENLDKHKKWFAHYFLRIYKHGSNEEARDEMERFINQNFLRPPDGTNRDWFSRFLGDEPSERWGDGFTRLTKAFRELSAAEMRRLIKQPTDKIPSLDLDFPLP